MDIRGKVHCLFEQSGTFKNEFRKLGVEAYDYVDYNIISFLPRDEKAPIILYDYE